MARSVARMLHAFGDAPTPLPAAVDLLLAHGLACARAILQAMRSLTGRAQLRVQDFATLLPASTHVYFRWRRMKAMGTAGTAAVAGGGGEEEEEGGLLPSALAAGEEEDA
jgi:hypothetical protein